MVEQWSKLLKSLGFTESESAIYLLSLEMGPASVQNLARKARVSRVTTYAVIESLSSHGLMSSMQKGKKKLYAAESPERLLSFVGQRMKTMEATFREVEQLLPDLKLLQRGEKPVVKFFEGKEGLKALQDDIIHVQPKHIDELANRDAIGGIVNHQELQPFRDWLGKAGVTGRMLYAGADTYDPKRAGVAVRRVNEKTVPFTGDIIIYESRVSLATFKSKLVVVIIESEEIVQTFRALFELAWRSAS